MNDRRACSARWKASTLKAESLRVPGRWLDAELPDEDGAKLFNVAISRSQHHLAFFANIEYLDKKLTAQSLLRQMLSDAQAGGRTIDVQDVLSYYPIIDDLKRYGRSIDLDPDTKVTRSTWARQLGNENQGTQLVNGARFGGQLTGTLFGFSRHENPTLEEQEDCANGS
jgi:hypothetical protein